RGHRVGSPAIQFASGLRETPLAQDAPLYRRLWRAWRRMVRAIGTLLSRTVLTVVYFIGLPPFAIALRRSSDPLQLRPRPATWTPPPPAGGLEQAKRGS